MSSGSALSAKWFADHGWWTVPVWSGIRTPLLHSRQRGMGRSRFWINSSGSNSSSVSLILVTLLKVTCGCMMHRTISCSTVALSTGWRTWIRMVRLTGSGCSTFRSCLVFNRRRCLSSIRMASRSDGNRSKCGMEKSFSHRGCQEFPTGFSLLVLKTDR